MPEGPEIRTVCSALAPIVVGQTLHAIEWTDKSKKHKLLSSYSLLPLPATIAGLTCRGKKIVFILQTSRGMVFLTSTLGMTGRWCWERGNHSHLWLRLGGSLATLWYDDPRHFGNIDLSFNPSETIIQIRKEIGPDLLAYSLQLRGLLLEEELVEEEDQVTSERWAKVVTNPRTRNQQVCRFLMDQRKFSGIGNYLKCEILYRSGIAPYRSLGSLTLAEITDLRTQALDTIYESFTAGGLTIATYWDPDGKRGTFQPKVYGRDTDEHGRQIERGVFDDGRTTYWCPEVQT